MNTAKFTIGQIIQHKLFNYHGVIIDVDYKFLGSEEWYNNVAHSRPPKENPWYHVLVDNATHQTYVAEQNIQSSAETKAITHPLLQHYFTGMKDGYYQLKTQHN